MVCLSRCGSRMKSSVGNDLLTFPVDGCCALYKRYSADSICRLRFEIPRHRAHYWNIYYSRLCRQQIPSRVSGKSACIVLPPCLMCSFFFDVRKRYRSYLSTPSLSLVRYLYNKRESRDKYVFTLYHQWFLQYVTKNNINFKCLKVLDETSKKESEVYRSSTQTQRIPD